MNVVFPGKFIEVTVENGIERVFLKGSVHTFLITDEGKVRLTIEHVLGRENTKEKIQGGMLECEESPESCARRELLEEMGIEARNWRHFLTLATSGTINDVRHYFLAKDFEKVSSEVDGEILGVKDYTLEELYEKAMAGEFSPTNQAAIAKLYFEVSHGNITL